jgi:hypothetical protein
MKPKNLEQLNEVIVQPLRQALINNEHVEVFQNYDKSNWELCAAAHSLENPDLNSQEVLNAFDRHLYTILDNGQAPCNSNFLALAYGYTYLYQRINAIENAFMALNYGSNKTRETGLFVDMGCGIGALLVALRNLHENDGFILNYRGYDIVQDVFQVNESILNNIYPNNITTIDHNCIDSFGKNKDTEIKHVIMVFSYIFSQNGIDENSLKSFKERVDSLFYEFDLKRFYIVYINIQPSYHNINYKKFMKSLEDGYEIVSNQVSQKYVDNDRLYNLSADEKNLKIVPSLKNSSNIHCTVSEIKRV